MAFKLVYLSQQDAQWKKDILGFGDPGDTIGYVGCALTSVAMLLSGHGYNETPKTLNKKLKNVGGFSGALIIWDAVRQLYPQATVKSSIACYNTNAPLDLIDASIRNGQPAIVMVDSSPIADLQTHWVLLYEREGNDYLMLDPVPYQTDVTKKTYMMPRYAQGKSLQRAINYVILYQVFGSGGTGSAPSTGTPQTQPTTGTVPGGVYARVKTDVTWGLNIRSSIDTSSMANVLATVPAGTDLVIVEADGAAKIGAINQWVRVRDSSGREGYAAAWYLENIPGDAPAPVPEPAPTPVPSEVEAPASTPAPAPQPEKLIVKVKSAGAKVYKTASKKAAVVCTEKSGARLVVVEARGKATAKIGVAGEWLSVKATNGKRGYVDGGSVRKG
jgi:hypothetical protein